MSALLLILFLLGYSADAGDATAVTATATQLTANTVTEVSAACATTDTTWDHDSFLEGFQTATTGVQDGNTWSTNFVGTVANINPVYDISGDSGRTNGQCSQAFRLTVPTDGTETYIRWTNSLASSVDWWTYGATIKMRFNVRYGIGSGDDFILIRLQDHAADLVCNVDLDETGGTTRSQGSGFGNSGYFTYATNTWHTFTLVLTAGSTNATFAVNDGTPLSFAVPGGGLGRTNISKILVGAPANLEATDDVGPLDFDLIAINTP